MRPDLAFLAASLSLIVPAAAARAPTTIAALNGPTAVESYGAVEVWSTYNPTSHSWQLTVRRNGRISTLPIPTAGKAIEADVGPGPSGVPMLTYPSCTSNCDVVVSGVDGSDPQTVPGSEGASHPTIWGDHVAWVRGDTKVIYSRLNGSERKILPGAPRRKCYYIGNETETTKPRLVCAATEHPNVDALQLYRKQLALIDNFRIPDIYEGAWEVRTENTAGGSQHLVAILDVGIGEESWLGPSWSNGKLYFYEDSSGAGFKVYRYNPANSTYALAPVYAYLNGFSVIGDRAYETTASSENDAIGTCQQEEPCVLRLSEPFAFKPTRAPVHVP